MSCCGQTSCGKIGGVTVAVIDAKYKAEKPAGYPNADLYQLLAYCTVLGLRNGHLIYAKGNEEPARHVVRQAGVEIVCHALDLSLAPDMLIGQMHDLARTIASAGRTARDTARRTETATLQPTGHTPPGHMRLTCGSAASC